jgi:serine protease Do
VKPVRYTYGITTALLLGGAALSLATSAPAGAQDAQNAPRRIQPIVPHAGAPTSFAALTEQLAPAVVNISTRQRVRVAVANPFAGTPFEDLFGGGPPSARTREAQSLGSGFIISADGFVVTNNHVIAADGRSEVESITVTMPDGSEYPAKVVGRDPGSDIAVLKISRSKPFPFVEFGDSRSARVGDWVIAIGNPFGLGSPYGRYIQTDAAINRGNSGGPMFDMKGQVIGINNAIFSPNGGSVGIGFAIPAEIAAPIVEKLKAGETIDRGYLGVRIQPLSDDLADSLGLPRNAGAFVQSAEPGQPAAEAGIRAGDVIVEVDGKEVTPRQSLSYLVANRTPGDSVAIGLIRNGRRMRVTVTLDARPSEADMARQDFGGRSRPGELGGPSESRDDSLAEMALGLSVQPLTPAIARQLGVAEDTTGLVVDAVDPSSDAARKGLRRGDVVLSASNRPVARVAELESRIREARDDGREALLLRVQRRGRPALYMAIRLR